MSRVCDSVCKFCRRENQKLFLKGDRCYTDKCAFERRPYPPGQHGQSRLKFSEYALQLREKQKTKRYYGVFEKQFQRYFAVADSAKGVTGTTLLQLLEMRMDNIAYLAGFAASRREAKHLVSHKHFLLNGQTCNIPSQLLRAGDIVQVKEQSRETNKIMAAQESAKKREIPKWLQVEPSSFSVSVKEKPGREEITLPVEENMIVEYYSR